MKAAEGEYNAMDVSTSLAAIYDNNSNLLQLFSCPFLAAHLDWPVCVCVCNYSTWNEYPLRKYKLKHRKKEFSICDIGKRMYNTEEIKCS